MNINNKYQQGVPASGQTGVQAQQILLQELQQGNHQSQQLQHISNPNVGQYSQNDGYNDGLNGLNQSNYQLPQMQQQFYPQLFLQQGQQGPIGSIQMQYQQPVQPSLLQQKSQHSTHPHQQGLQDVQLQQLLQYFSQLLNSSLLQLLQNNAAIAVENSNSIYWQQQIQLHQISKSANVPHFYARLYASNSRKLKSGYNDMKFTSLVDATKASVSNLEEHEKSINASAVANTSNTALLHNKKLVVEEETEEQRMRHRTQGKQLWCQLDISGQGLTNLSSKLFRYDFLESLYLNNNNLTSVPQLISKFRGLRTLDLSENKITELPVELGLCYNLRYLYLFDNEIKTLPREFGNLIELLFLGIEGNPMDSTLVNILADKGTKALIEHIRDEMPYLEEPKPRPWILLEDDQEIETQIPPSSSDSFTFMTYNTLCQHYATKSLYRYTPAWALDWDYRRNILQKEILNYGSDIICLQEVETRTYHEFWTPIMAEHGYKGAFFPKSRSKTMGEIESKKVDGLATFYKTDKFNLILKQNFEFNSVCMGSDKYKKTKDLFNRFMNKDNVSLITFFQHIGTEQKFVVCNTHLHWDPALNDVKTLQVGILLEELKGICKKFYHLSSNDDINNCSIIICGDFNSTKNSAVHQLFSTGLVHKHEDLEGRNYGKFTEIGFHNPFTLRSAYDIIGELPFTNLTPSFTNVIDYIWYSPSNLEVKGLLGKIDERYIENVIGFPSIHIPSDHIPIVSKFMFKTAASKKPDIKPDFKAGSTRKT